MSADVSRPYDRLDVNIEVGDTVTVIVWGGKVRLSDTGQQFTVTGFSRAGNVTHDSSVSNGAAVPPSYLAVARRDGLQGHEGNRTA